MDINQVKFGNYSIGNPKGGSSKKSEEKASETQTQKQPKQVGNFKNPDDFMKALDVAGMQNIAFIARPSVEPPNPIEFLGEKRISDIEAMMAEFDAGVGLVAQAIEAEFPGMLAPDQINALAAKIFAAE